MAHNQPWIDDSKLATEVTLKTINRLRDSDKCVTITLNTVTENVFCGWINQYNNIGMII